MNALVLSRRHLLGATAAASAVGFPAVAEAGFPATVHADAALLDLIRWHAEAVALTEALNDACHAPSELFHVLEPERPSALDYRHSDVLHDLGGASLHERRPHGRVRAVYSGADVARLEAAPPLTMWGPHADDEVPFRVPDLAGEARRREIVQASGAWSDARRALSEAVGLRAANAAVNDALGVETNIEDAILAAVPATMEGLRAKAAWIVATPSDHAGGRALDMLRALAERGGAAA